MFCQFCKRWPKPYNAQILIYFWDTVIDGTEILNGDVVTVILSIKDVMDTKAN